MDNSITAWLMSGDVSIQFQTARDLLGLSEKQTAPLRARIALEGWGKVLLEKRRDDGHWANGLYSPKWTCTHYTLLELVGYGISPENEPCRQSAGLMLACKRGKDGGINYARTIEYSDVCINGMILNIASYFRLAEADVVFLVDYLLERRMDDGAWNCLYYRGDKHSSLHTTIGVLEGCWAYIEGGYAYRSAEVRDAMKTGIEFLLKHRLFRSHRNGTIIDPKMLKFPYPPRWKYDILRALELLAASGTAYDPRIDDALDELMKKKRKDGTWPFQANHPGQVHIELEEAGKPSRWNTLRALRVLKRYGKQQAPVV